MGQGIDRKIFHGCSSTSDSVSSDDEIISHSNRGPLYNMSSLKDQIPSKSGLSMFYRGKSESFTNLSDVSCVEDLAKKPKKEMNLCRSYPSCPSLPPAIHVREK